MDFIRKAWPIPANAWSTGKKGWSIGPRCCFSSLELYWHEKYLLARFSFELFIFKNIFFLENPNTSFQIYSKILVHLSSSSMHVPIRQYWLGTLFKLYCSLTQLCSNYRNRKMLIRKNIEERLLRRCRLYNRLNT